MPRDFSKPYTEAELEVLKDQFCSLPSYKIGIGITSADIPALIKLMEYPRTEEQVEAYIKYWDDSTGGILSLENFLGVLSGLHESSKMTRELAVRSFGFEESGYTKATAEKFGTLLTLMSAHDPSIPKKLYQEFEKEADINEDGDISIDELVQWIEKYTSG